VLRVLGRAFPAPPPGQTVVTLVDATGRRASAPVLVLRVVPTPTVAMERPELEPPSTDVAASTVFIVGGHPAWDAALRADPVVRAFLDRDL
jgi:hypothetical protein